MAHHVRSWAIAALAAFALFMVPITPTMAGIVLSSNMEATWQGSYSQFENNLWIAAPFRTTSDLNTITGVDLKIDNRGDYNGGNMAIDIWTSKGANLGPAGLLSSIYNGGYPGSLVSISGLSLTLNPGTEYFVVARGVNFNDIDNEFFSSPGGLAWLGLYGNNFTHSGTGFVFGSWQSAGDPDSWNPSNSDSFKMTVYAASSNSSVPEIDPAMGSSALSLVAGVLAMIEQRRRRATLVA